MQQLCVVQAPLFQRARALCSHSLHLWPPSPIAAASAKKAPLAQEAPLASEVPCHSGWQLAFLSLAAQAQSPAPCQPPWRRQLEACRWQSSQQGCHAPSLEKRCLCSAAGAGWLMAAAMHSGCLFQGMRLAAAGALACFVRSPCSPSSLSPAVLLRNGQRASKRLGSCMRAAASDGAKSPKGPGQ